MTTPLAYFDLIETFAKPGCAICNLLLHGVEGYLDALLYEFANEPQTLFTFRDARGLCNEHGWQLTHFMGTSLGVAILYEAVISEVSSILDQNPIDESLKSRFSQLLNNGPSTGSGLANRLEPVKPCPVCESLAKSETTYIHVFSHYMDESRLQEAYRASNGLCLPHFRQVLRQRISPATLQFILSTQRAIWAKLEAELNEFMDKNRPERVHEEMGVEKDSWRRAIGQMAGAKGVFGTKPRDP